MTVLTIKNVNKSFNDKQVLSDICFDLKQNTVLSLIGESGVGKSTILRIICGLESQDSGEVKMNQAGSIGLVFQDYNLFPHLTVLENLVLPQTKVLKMEKSKAEICAVETLKQLKIDDKKDSMPYELSGGQKQRVAIARALVMNPSVLCFDEPTSALAPKTIASFVDIVNELKKKMAILIVTHDMNFAMQVSDQFIFMDAGKIKLNTDKKGLLESDESYIVKYIRNERE